MDRRNPFHHHHHLQHHLIQQQQQQIHQPPPLSMTAPMDPGGGIDQRLPQWSLEETNELLAIREELDQTFMETKRNKVLWEVVATRMADKGFVRSSEQCKSKWKNLVTRYKACEATEGDGIRQQFPFYNEIQSILAARVQRMLWAEATEPSTSSKRKHNQLSSDEEEEDEEEEEEQKVDHAPYQDINKELLSMVETQKKETEVISTCTTPRKRAKRGKGVAGTSTKSETTLKEVLEEFMRQTVKMEKEWREAWETKERERERRENEWRRRMAELEEERAAAERRWMEREEERRLREEARAQRRETLIDALLNKLNSDHNDGHSQGFC